MTSSDNLTRHDMAMLESWILKYFGAYARVPTDGMLKGYIDCLSPLGATTAIEGLKWMIRDSGLGQPADAPVAASMILRHMHSRDTALTQGVQPDNPQFSERKPDAFPTPDPSCAMCGDEAGSRTRECAVVHCPGQKARLICRPEPETPPRKSNPRQWAFDILREHEQGRQFCRPAIKWARIVAGIEPKTSIN